MKVLVTGANGMLGQDLCPILEDIGCFVISTDYETLNILDRETVEKIVSDIHPDLIIHCAAYTNVDKAEEDIEGATKLNVEGTENIARAASGIDATLVYISTDYVFEGTNNTPYLPTDEPNPKTVYGLTKYQGEIMVKKYCKKYYIARTSWLYGINGKNFVETMISMAAKPEIKVVDDQIGCPTWTVDLANGILKLLNKPYGIYHLCGGGEISWYGFAKEIFNLANLDVNLKPCTTEEFPRPAKRPAYSVMENNGILRPWQEALLDYMNLRKERG